MAKSEKSASSTLFVRSSTVYLCDRSMELGVYMVSPSFLETTIYPLPKKSEFPQKVKLCRILNSRYWFEIKIRISTLRSPPLYKPNFTRLRIVIFTRGNKSLQRSNIQLAEQLHRIQNGLTSIPFLGEIFWSMGGAIAPQCVRRLTRLIELRHRHLYKIG